MQVLVVVYFVHSRVVSGLFFSSNKTKNRSSTHNTALLFWFVRSLLFIIAFSSSVVNDSESQWLNQHLRFYFARSFNYLSIRMIHELVAINWSGIFLEKQKKKVPDNTWWFNRISLELFRTESPLDPKSYRKRKFLVLQMNVSAVMNVMR